MVTRINFLILCFIPCALTKQYFYWYTHVRKYSTSKAAELMPKRIIHLMDVYFLDGQVRATDLTDMRNAYEESPHYETGYIISEILERYRKMVMLMKTPMAYRSVTLPDTVEKLEKVQELYFELYHLVNMAHEIPRKWSHRTEFSGVFIEPLDAQAFYEAKDQQKYEAKVQQVEHKKQEQYKQRLEAMIKERQTKEQAGPGATRSPKYNRWWPLEYGWEIDYYW